jgi:hypothetical protein
MQMQNQGFHFSAVRVHAWWGFSFFFWFLVYFAFNRGVMSTAARTRNVHVFDVRSGVRASATVRRTGTAMDATPAEFAKLRAELRRQLLGALETCGLSPPDDFSKFVLQGTDFVVDSWAMLEELERHADAVMAHFEPPTYDVVKNVASGFCVLEYACVLRTAGNADAYDGMVCGFPLLYTVANIAKYFGVAAKRVKFMAITDTQNITSTRIRVAKHKVPVEVATAKGAAIYDIIVRRPSQRVTQE